MERKYNLQIELAGKSQQETIEEINIILRKLIQVDVKIACINIDASDMMLDVSGFITTEDE